MFQIAEDKYLKKFPQCPNPAKRNIGLYVTLGGKSPTNFSTLCLELCVAR